MAFQKIDDTACIADKALSSALGTYLLRSVQAPRTARRRSAGWAMDVRTPAYLSGDGSGGGLAEGDYTAACVLPMLWRPSRLDVSEITVELWARALSGSLEAQVAVKVVTLASLLSYGPGEEPEDWTSISSTTDAVYTITASLAGLRWAEGDLLVVLLAVRSEVGAVQVLYDVKASVDTTGVTAAITGNGSRVETDPLALWGGSDAQADTRGAFRLLFGSADTSGTFDPAAFEPGGPWGLAGYAYGSTPALHGLAQVGNDIYVYPRIAAEVNVPSTTSAIARQLLGAIHLSGLTVLESDGGSFGLSEDAFAIGAPASGTLVGALVQEVEDQFVLQDGPVALATGRSTLTDQATGAPVSRVFTDNVIVPTGAWFRVGACVAGTRRSQLTPAGGSTSYRNTYVVDALVVWVSANNVEPVEAPLEFRLVLADSGGDIDGEAVVVAATSLPFAPNGTAEALRDHRFLAGHLFGWTLEGGYAYRDRHSLRDMLPWELLRRGPTMFRVRCEVTSSGTEAPLVGVPLHLEARFAPNTSYPPGSGVVGHDAIHVLSLLADWPVSNNPADLGD